MRVRALALLFVVLGGACGMQKASDQAAGTPGSRKVGEGVVLPGDKTPGATAAQQAGNRVAPNQDGKPEPTKRPPIKGAPIPGNNATRLYNDKGTNGSNSVAYVTSKVPRLIIEIVAVRGMEPSQEALDAVRKRVAAVVDKPGGIEFKLLPSISRTAEKYGTGELAEIEAKYRTTWTSNEAAAIFVAYVNGSSDPSGSAGFAWRSSLIAMFPESFRQLGTSQLQPERVVLLHEVGHLLGMVNLGYESPRDHCDCDPARGGGHHSKNPKSVMYAGVETITGLQGIATSGSVPDDFDADDKADFADIRSGKIKPYNMG